MNRRLTLMVAGALIAGLAIGLAIVFFETRSENRGVNIRAIGENTPVSIEFRGSCAALTREEMIEQADLVFVGRVVNIAPTRWNQDSGEYWDEDETQDPDSSLLYHEIELAIIRPIIDTIGVGEKVVITVLGNSPVGPQPEVPGLKVNGQPVIVVEAGSPEHDLKVDDQAIFFAEQREIAWRGGIGGMRPVVSFMGCYRDSYLVQGKDGLYHFWRPDLEPPISLEALIVQIAQRRETPVQP